MPAWRAPSWRDRLSSVGSGGFASLSVTLLSPRASTGPCCVWWASTRCVWLLCTTTSLNHFRIFYVSRRWMPAYLVQVWADYLRKCTNTFITDYWKRSGWANSSLMWLNPWKSWPSRLTQAHPSTHSFPLMQTKSFSKMVLGQIHTQRLAQVFTLVSFCVLPSVQILPNSSSWEYSWQRCL